MKAVILAGGLGTRLSEEAVTRPKPMVEIGGRPILWHILKLYSAHGITDFVICAGYPTSKAAASTATIGLANTTKANLFLGRIFQVFGEGEAENRLWPSLRKAALAGEDFPMTPGEQIRDFIPVEDVAARFLAEATHLSTHIRIANVGTWPPPIPPAIRRALVDDMGSERKISIWGDPLPQRRSHALRAGLGGKDVMNLILGSGLAGISASYHIWHHKCLVLEKNPHSFGHIHS
jgi:nucleoside-diphosphate-sugar epimerase